MSDKTYSQAEIRQIENLIPQARCPKDNAPLQMGRFKEGVGMGGSLQEVICPRCGARGIIHV